MSSSYGLSLIGNSVQDYAGSGSQFDSDYLKSALLPEPFTSVTSRPSSSSSHTSNLDPPRFESASWDNDLYRFEPDAEQPHHHDSQPPPAVAAVALSVASPSRSPSPRVKQEELVSDDFVFEGPLVTGQFPAFASMTEVPLRCTGASKEARRMMGVFRLDPFTIHNAARPENANTDWSGEQIGPLRHKPRTFEFQLELDDAIKPEQPPCLTAVDSPVQSPSLSTSSLSYPNDPEDEEREQTQSWVSSPPSRLYSPPTVSEPFVPNMTPAQLEWQMNYQNTAANPDGRYYSSSPPSSRE